MSHASVFLSMRLRHLRQTKVTSTRYHRVLGHADRIFDTFASCTSCYASFFFQVKKSAAMEEKAWKGCGRRVGLKIWRIEKFKASKV